MSHASQVSWVLLGAAWVASATSVTWAQEAHQEAPKIRVERKVAVPQKTIDLLRPQYPQVSEYEPELTYKFTCVAPGKVDTIRLSAYRKRPDGTKRREYADIDEVPKGLHKYLPLSLEKLDVICLSEYSKAQK